MTVTETKDANLIRFVMSECYSEMADDGDPAFKDYWPQFENKKYLAGFVGGKVIGVVVYCYNKGKTHIHICVRPKHRARYAGILARKALKDRAGTIYTEIPDLYPNVIKFAERFGFKVIDRTKACTKHGKRYAINTLRLDQ